MSLESELKANTAALVAQTAAIEALTTMLSETGAAVMTVGKTPDSEDKPAGKKAPTAAQKKAAAEKKAAEEAAAEEEQEEEEEPKKPAKSRRTAKPKANTVETVTEAYTGYLGEADDDEDELDTRRGNVRAVLDHLGAKKIRDLAEDQFDSAISLLDTFKAGKTPDFMNEEEEEGDDDLV